MDQDIAEHLTETYGGRAVEIAELAMQHQQAFSRLAENFPYIDAEIVYACREYACTVEDVLSRRTRLAFLDKQTALNVIPRVANIMANEMGWTEKVKKSQILACQNYVDSYGGRSPHEQRC
jgi:glycerol-3-phosphate dehydrogenase